MELANDVWSTLDKAVDTAAKVKSIFGKPAQTQTQAAPQGAPSTMVFNPFPGLFSSTPQADGKPLADGSAANGIGMIAVLAVVVLVIVALFRR